MANVIGVLDSGVGGLSVLSQLVKIMPKQKYIYFGDTKNMPYGTKTKAELLQFTKNIIDFFIDKKVHTVVFACNTTSATVYDDLVEYYQGKVKIYPLIQSVAFEAIKGLKDGDTVAVLATLATIKSKKYDEEIKKINKNINVAGIECSGFTEIVENRLYSKKASIDLIKEKLELVKKSKAKRVVLGCTHYPYLEYIFKNFLDVEYFNPASCLAEIVKNENYTETSQDKGEIKFYTTKSPEDFKLSGRAFFDIRGEVELVEFK